MWASVVGALLVWMLCAHALVPWVIEEAYHGRSLGFLNRFISGSSTHPLQQYLEQWRQTAKSVTFVFATIGLIVASIASFRSLVQARRDRAFASEDSGRGWSRLRARCGDLLPVAVWFGLVVGLGEAWYIAGRAYYVHQVIGGFRWVSRNSIWMAPAADLALFLGLALVVVAASLLLTRRRAFQVGMFVLSLAAGLILLLLPGRLHWLAALILALGLAYQFLGYARRNPGALYGATRASLLPLMAVWVTAAIAVSVWERPHTDARTATQEVAADQPSVLLIILDTVRARSMGLYGHERRNTPTLERLASRGVVFDRAIATTSWTLPSHASMFTGRFNSELGTDQLTPLDDTYRTLAEELTARGFATGGFIANIFFCSDFFGLDRGFERYVDEKPGVPMLLGSAWVFRTGVPAVRKLRGNRHPLVRLRADWVNREFLDWLSEIGDRPFFAFLNYFDGHGPFLPPKPYDRLYWPEEQPRYWLGPSAEVLSSDEVEQLNAAYDGSIAYLDAQLAALLEELEQAGRLQNTIVIVTSDHGESLTEHGKLGHGESVYMTEIRVPLLVLLPEGAYAGTRIGDPVSLRNVAATVMDLVGAGKGSPFPGYSLAPHWNGGAGNGGGMAGRSGDYVLSELVGRKSLVMDDYHYWRDRQGNEELYDLSNDPEELHDLTETGNEELRLRMGAALDQALEAAGSTD